MDLKVTRTKTGITALQMDMKIKGLSLSVFTEAFAQSETAVN
jgi:polyribonucleotide nucleotidyltransferase